MTDDLYDLADPFHGNDTTDLPTPSGIAASWFWPKAQAGNTHPGACHPNGMCSAAPYSGAYVTGYGCNGKSSQGPPPKLFSRKTAVGVTHFQNSGTGATEAYGNLLRVIPLARGISETPVRYSLIDEQARPGLYRCVLEEPSVTLELAAGPHGVAHRYTFAPSAESPTIAVDLTSGGLLAAGMRQKPSSVEIARFDDRSMIGRLVHQGIEVSFCVRLNATADTRGFWRGREVAGELNLPTGDGPESFQPAGVFWRTPVRVVEMYVGFSLRGADEAAARAGALADGFDATARTAESAWRERFARIRISGGTHRERTLFASSLYRLLIKPADCGDASPFWAGADAPFFLDFATLWDQYKTHLPLLGWVYPEVAGRAANALLALAENLGHIPICVQMDDDLDRFENQARALGHLVLVDMWDRRVPGVDWRRALDLLQREFDRDVNRDFFERGRTERSTHTLDMACACHAVARLAAGLGRTDTAARLLDAAGAWRNVFDPATGLLNTQSTYYEGTHWNYSFRPLPFMRERIALAGGIDAFCGLLDRFFGYGAPPVRQPAFEPDQEAQSIGLPLGRFEGLNNEPDMETPWTYCFAGRHDRTAEVIRSALTYAFAPGPGGLPGNDDSGGLTSWYVWASIGLLPLPGQGRCLLGNGLFDLVEVDTPDGTFRMEWNRTSKRRIYIADATIDGRPLAGPELPYTQMTGGHTVTLTMSDTPADWGRSPTPDRGIFDSL